MTVSSGEDGSTTADWMTGKGPEGFISLGSQEPYVELLSDPRTFSVTQRVAAYGPVVVAQTAPTRTWTFHAGLCVTPTV